jgi:hypothetical protein
MCKQEKINKKDAKRHQTYKKTLCHLHISILKSVEAVISAFGSKRGKWKRLPPPPLHLQLFYSIQSFATRDRSRC